MRASFRICLPLLLLLVSSPLLAAAPDSTHEFTLDNGLKVVVREDRRAPVVVSQLWYRVGSSDEPPGLTGISHVLEHMMFKGSDNVEPGQASRLLSALGAQENAFTGRDYTGYYQLLSRDLLPIALELEAERMRGLTLPEDEFLSELEVIKEERRLRVDDNPNSLAYERFLTQTYMASPYSQPIIGWMHDIERLTVDDLRTWYDLHYHPGNAILVLAGDIDLATARELATTYFGPIPAGPVPPRRPPLELPAGGERSITQYLNVQLPTLLMAYNVPGLVTAEEDWEAYALRLLNGVLDAGHSARLASELERGSGIATSVGANYDAFSRGDTLFLFSGIPNQSRDADLEQLEAGIHAQIERLQAEPPSADELDRVRNQVIAQLVFAQDSISHQARLIGQLESVGLPWSLLDEDIERLQAITPEQVSDVARRYLQPERLTRSHVLPAHLKESR
ncbi:M16 family metallopeptidase [Halopseudomonas salegens]|uniref:M16 family metallopeptidase n=1 Tax=Halopseudomonas salegens TaxID=1434072 RepID=UPI0038B36285